MIYLDANATEKLRPAARSAALDALDLVGNPSSVHTQGRLARRVLERARVTVAGLLGGEPSQLVFTSGGTEANALGVMALSQGRRLLVGATEHDAVREAAPGAVVLDVDDGGQIDLGAFEKVVAHGGPALVCLMLANNETGVLHPIAEIAAICRAHGAWLHVDAVQAAGRLDVSLRALGAQSLAVSGHKFGGPKGAGALLLAPGIEIAAVMHGGGQEAGRRGGTPGLPAIAGLAAALTQAIETCDPARMARLRDHAEAAATAAGAVVCGRGDRLPNTTCIALPGRRSDLQVIALDLAGIAVSAGAACSSGKVARSHVLDAMGLAEQASTAIRVSLPWDASEADIAGFADAYSRMSRQTRG